MMRRALARAVLTASVLVIVAGVVGCTLAGAIHGSSR
jgi:hypothetical protein